MAQSFAAAGEGNRYYDAPFAGPHSVTHYPAVSSYGAPGPVTSVQTRRYGGPEAVTTSYSRPAAGYIAGGPAVTHYGGGAPILYPGAPQAVATQYPRGPAYYPEGPVDPHHYGGNVLGVEYVIHEPGWNTHSVEGPGPGPGYDIPPVTRPILAYRPKPWIPAPRTVPRHPAPPPYEPEPYAPEPYAPEPYAESVPSSAPSVVSSARPDVPYVDPDLRPYFGVGLKWLDSIDLGGKNDVAVVHEVLPNSPAANAVCRDGSTRNGILPEDQLEFWTNRTQGSPKTPINSEGVWKMLMRAMSINDEIELGIHRDGRDHTLHTRIQGTHRAKGAKKTVKSENKVFTDNL